MSEKQYRDFISQDGSIHLTEEWWKERKARQNESQEQLARTEARLERRKKILAKYPPLFDVGEPSP